MNAPEDKNPENPVVVETATNASPSTPTTPAAPGDTATASLAAARGVARPPSGEPLLPPREAGGAVDPTAVLTALRRFHLGGPDPALAGPDLQPIDPTMLPALLAPFRDSRRVRTPYPLYLDPPGEGPEGRIVAPLAEILDELVGSFAPGEEQARILKDNILRVEHHVREAVTDTTAPVKARPAIARAGDLMTEELGLSGENAERLEADLSALTGAIPEGATLVGFSPAAPLILLASVSRATLQKRRADFIARARTLCRGLQALLQVERTKTDEARAPEALSSSMGQAATRFMDPAKLARLEGSGRTTGTESMSAERRARIEKVLAVLLDYTAKRDLPDLIVVHDPEATDWLTAALGTTPGEESASVRLVAGTESCAAAARLFDEQAAIMAEVFKAARTARLEIADAFDPDRHAPWLAQFGWEAFSREEILLMPAVVALTSDEKLASAEMTKLSALLLSGRPVRVMVVSRPAGNPAFAAASGDPAAGFRLELGYLGLSHREVLVHQTSAVAPAHLVHGLECAAQATRPALHVIASSQTMAGPDSPVGPWFQASAAWESRAHALFLYDPEAGETWARRFDLRENPQTENDWPLYSITCRRAEGGSEDLEIPFTFADYAMLDPALGPHFCIAPPGCADEDLVSLGDYLRLDAESAARKVPYIWAIDAEQRLHRIVITRRLVFACRDRLTTWHNLCELAGIHNEYVEQAMTRVKAELAEESNRKIAEIEARHAEEIETVRREAAGEAMQRLAATLLETDLSAMLPAATTTTGATPGPPTRADTVDTAPAAGASTADDDASAAVEETEEEVAFDEPWIDSALCSSCNDCINLNPQLFVYNENKQATIGDPHAGTYAQIVQAAEKCASHCIHPGKPLDPNEPGLEELIKRAAKYN